MRIFVGLQTQKTEWFARLSETLFSWKTFFYAETVTIHESVMTISSVYVYKMTIAHVWLSNHLSSQEYYTVALKICSIPLYNAS